MLAQLSYKFIPCLDNYSLLRSNDRSSLLSRNAKIICNMGPRRRCLPQPLRRLRPGPLSCQGKVCIQHWYQMNMFSMSFHRNLILADIPIVIKFYHCRYWTNHGTVSSGQADEVLQLCETVSSMLKKW